MQAVFLYYCTNLSPGLKKPPSFSVSPESVAPRWSAQPLIDRNEKNGIPSLSTDRTYRGTSADPGEHPGGCPGDQKGTCVYDDRRQRGGRGDPRWTNTGTCPGKTLPLPRTGRGLLASHTGPFQAPVREDRRRRIIQPHDRATRLLDETRERGIMRTHFPLYPL